MNIDIFSENNSGLLDSLIIKMTFLFFGEIFIRTCIGIELCRCSFKHQMSFRKVFFLGCTAVMIAETLIFLKLGLLKSRWNCRELFVKGWRSRSTADVLHFNLLLIIVVKVEKLFCEVLLLYMGW